MATKRKDDSQQGASEATTKLSRLLETEIELEAMLKDARQEAKELVEAAKVAADDRVKLGPWRYALGLASLLIPIFLFNPFILMGM